MDDRKSVAQQGNCQWDWWTGVEDEMGKWADPAEDEVAILHLDNLVRLAEGPSGIRSNDLTAPEGRKLSRARLPWVGALKSVAFRRRGSEGKRNYRLYFSEVPEGEKALLASRLSWKCTGWTDEYTETHQTKQIRDAVGIVEKYCKMQGCGCRVIVTTS